MYVHVAPNPGQENKVRKKIELMSGTSVTVSNPNEIIVKLDKCPANQASVTRLENKFKQIRGVLRVTPVLPHLNVEDVSLRESFRTNRCVMFFDIDSTLTQGKPGTIHHKIKPIFQKIKDKGINIFLATGRSMPDLADIVRKYPVQRYAIAENGGIILGFGSDNYIEFGDKKEPDKVLNYIRVKYGTPEDMDQGTRLTEVIFLTGDISKKRLDKAIKTTRAKVDVHTSKNSYHISKRGINKGTAMLELCTRLHFDNQMVIAIGDADMDIPMFKKADYSFAVGNASPNAKKAAKKVLK